MEFSERLRELRTSKNIKQKDLADALNYGYTAISNYESGKNEPSINDLRTIGKALDISLDYLLGATDIKAPYASSASLDYESRTIINKYFSLSEEEKFELLTFIDWIEFKKSSKSKLQKKLKVAQPIPIYKTKSNCKEEE